LASYDNGLYVAWKGSGNDNLNIMLSEDNGASFGGKHTSDQTSDASPALVSAAGQRLFIAWKGVDNQDLNVAKVRLFSAEDGHIGVEGLEDQVILNETTSTAPALALQTDLLFLGWKGSGNDNLNIALSHNSGLSMSEKFTSEEASAANPALVSHSGQIYIAWKGSGNDNLNVAMFKYYGSVF
jgi:hypothetical protein